MAQERDDKSVILRFSHFHVFAFRRGFWNWQAVFAQPLQMQRDRLGDQLLHLSGGFANSHAAGQIWHIGTVARWAFFDDNRVSHQSSSGNCACFQMLFSVLIGTSTFIWPETVTRPRLAVCLN